MARRSSFVYSSDGPDTGFLRVLRVKITEVSYCAAEQTRFNSYPSPTKREVINKGVAMAEERARQFTVTLSWELFACYEQCVTMLDCNLDRQSERCVLRLIDAIEAIARRSGVSL